MNTSACNPAATARRSRSPSRSPTQTHAITNGLADWTTIHEEHYNNIKVFDTAHALAHGTQVIKNQAGQPQRTNDFVVAWANIYQGKTRVFSTTIGHNNETVADARYLDLVTRGVLWACDKLDADGKPKPGYAAEVTPARSLNRIHAIELNINHR